MVLPRPPGRLVTVHATGKLIWAPPPLGRTVSPPSEAKAPSRSCQLVLMYWNPSPEIWATTALLVLGPLYGFASGLMQPVQPDPSPPELQAARVKHRAIRIRVCVPRDMGASP